MRPDHNSPGGATVAVLNRLEAWEAALVIDLRMWCDGPSGQAEVWNGYRRSLPGQNAKRACRSFEILLTTLIKSAYRPLVRHDTGCSCVGADENILVNLVRTASDGQLNDAALIATLIAGPAQAEHIAVLAGEVGETLRHMHREDIDFSTEVGGNVVRLH
ncbi:MAG: hypothetical protein AAF999_10400 [Pseudomonadota bacterium]